MAYGDAANTQDREPTRTVPPAQAAAGEVHERQHRDREHARQRPRTATSLVPKTSIQPCSTGSRAAARRRGAATRDVAERELWRC